MCRFALFLADGVYSKDCIWQTCRTTGRFSWLLLLLLAIKRASSKMVLTYPPFDNETFLGKASVRPPSPSESQTKGAEEVGRWGEGTSPRGPSAELAWNEFDTEMKAYLWCCAHFILSIVFFYVLYTYFSPSLPPSLSLSLSLSPSLSFSLSLSVYSPTAKCDVIFTYVLCVPFPFGWGCRKHGSFLAEGATCTHVNVGCIGTRGFLEAMWNQNLTVWTIARFSGHWFVV